MCVRYNLHSNKACFFMFDDCYGLVQPCYNRLELSANMTTKVIVLATINKAAIYYKFKEGMIFHSDRGVRYVAKATRNVLESYNILQSMGGAGDCWDNAVVESFFKSLKTELIYGTELRETKKMRNEIFEYIETWYRKQRRYPYLGYQTIEEFNKTEY